MSDENSNSTFSDRCKALQCSITADGNFSITGIELEDLSKITIENNNNIESIKLSVCSTLEPIYKSEVYKIHRL